MGILKVWAPIPNTVELEIDGLRLPMEKVAGEWWEIEASEIIPEARYGFIVDGKGPFPDPRSPRLPDGVHGLGEIVDHSEFPWDDSSWQAPPLSTSSLIYELHVGTFTHEGTFDGLVGKLDHLIELGVTHVELMPVNTFAGTRGWGYDGTGLYAPFEPYGGPNGLKRLVNTCHQRGLAVLLDVVYNHFGPEGNYLDQFAPYLLKGSRTNWGEAVNLDGPGSDEVRRFFLDNALMWLRDYHLDGLRIDAVHALRDQSPRHYLRELRGEVNQLTKETGRRYLLIAESDLNDPRVVQPTSRGGHGMDAQWSDDFHHCLHVQLTGESDGYFGEFQGLDKLAKSIRQAFVYDGIHSPGRGKRHGESPDGLDGRSFLAYIQNHDQVGNRPRGDRIGHLCSCKKLKIAAALVFVSPFVPMIFQGEEWGASSPLQYFTDFQDKDLGRAVREGRLGEFTRLGFNPVELPDPQSPETYLRSKLNWAEKDEEEHHELLGWYRKLIRLRRDRYDLRSPAFTSVETAYSEENRWFALRRGRHQILVNFSPETTEVPLFEGTGMEPLLASGDWSVPVGDALIRLGGDSIVLLGPP